MQLIRKIAFPISLLYALVVYIRNLCYDIGVFKSTSYNTPTICIGNLSIGGTGKTPMIEYVLRLLKNDYKTAVLSRGYRRKSKGFLLADKASTVADLGDEPFQIYSKFDGIIVAVDTDRRNAIANLEHKVHPDLIVLDDAFQHRKVKPKLSVLLTTFSNIYVKDWYLPTGDLRDTKSQAKRADIVVVTKCPANITENEKRNIIRLIKPKDHQQVLFSKLVYSDFVAGEQDKIPLSDIKERHFSLVTGIANSKPLIDFLKFNGNSFEHFKYPDHHNFSENDIKNFSKNELIITTEKDFTKLKRRCEHLYYLEVKHQFFDKGELHLREAIKNIMSDFLPSS